MNSKIDISVKLTKKKSSKLISPGFQRVELNTEVLDKVHRYKKKNIQKARNLR